MSIAYCIFEFMRFLKHYGFTGKCSNLLRYGGTRNVHFVANFVPNLAVK